MEDTVFTVADMATARHKVEDSKKNDTMKKKQKMQTPTKAMPINKNAKHAEKCTKLKTAATGQMRQKTHDARGATSPSPPKQLVNNPCPPLQPSQKTKIAARTFRGKRRREGEHHRRTPTLL